MTFKRYCGILMHITSLPGRFGIGDLGPAAYHFVDFLKESGQSSWQFLPTGPVCRAFDYSPYMSLSAFAGNPLLISPEKLVEAGFLSAGEIENCPDFSEYRVSFNDVVPFREKIFRSAFDKFVAMGHSETFEQFCRKEPWLEDYALFMSLREENNQKSWSQWPSAVASRNEKSLTACRKRLSEEILYHKFVQYLFFEQWSQLRRYCSKKGIKLIGDIPIYVGMDSADVWSHQDCFELDKKSLQPTHVAGVPPDYFSKTGQRWGNPLYRWHKGKGINRSLYEWWRQRFDKIGAMVDVVRIDHFRGFEAYWEIPAVEKTAVKGVWKKGPGKFFFEQMTDSIGDLSIIAEDLGIITPEVEELRDSCGFPGMKILQFAFDSGAENSYLPHNFTTTNCVIYSGTHDNDTTLGWYFDSDVSQAGKDRAVRYANSEGDRIHWDFLRLAYGSVADLAVIPMQDVLGFGNDCRMNLPSSKNENWRWRCASRFLTVDISHALLDEVLFYNRHSVEETKATVPEEDVVLWE
ncbi:MAG: 4-alpha-glucanotransferase [Thermodesulfobacteriota bacterium]|nr:4-alpha-glucanotransferase [Thermodesulfobacteriota bacterium]